MKKSKHFISITILMSLVLQCLGCGSSAGSETTGDSSTTLISDSTETNLCEYEAPNVNYGGKTVTMTGYSYQGAWAILRYNIALDEENGDIINDAIVKRNRAVEDALNVNIELIPLASSDRNSPAMIQKYILAQEDVVTVGMQMAAGLSSSQVFSAKIMRSVPNISPSAAVASGTPSV